MTVAILAGLMKKQTVFLIEVGTTSHRKDSRFKDPILYHFVDIDKEKKKKTLTHLITQ